jgi:hypothetical protein
MRMLALDTLGFRTRADSHESGAFGTEFMASFEQRLEQLHLKLPASHAMSDHHEES